MFDVRYQKIRVFAAAIVAFTFLVSAVPTRAEKPIVLNLASYLPPGEPSLEEIRKFFNSLEKLTNGLVKTKFHVAGAMGKPPDHYELALQGVADIAYIGTSYTPGTFQRVEIFDLPIAGASAEIMDRALVKMWKMGYFEEDFRNVKLITLDSISPYQLYWVKDNVETIAEMQGKKMRATGNYVPKAIKALGGVPVFVPAPDCYLLMNKGTVDGTVMPWAGMKDFNLHEVTKYVTECNMFYFVYALVMNKGSWEKLPEVAKKFIDENGMPLSVKCGIAWDAFCVESRDLFLKSGGKVVKFQSGETEKMAGLLGPIWKEWIDMAQAKGWPAKREAADLYRVLKESGVPDPFVGYRP
jgi:TRAP-type C4-dicarboxylate transport system substrate-binding protein